MQAFQSPSLGLAVVLWYVGGAFVAGFVAALIVKAILDTDPAQSARLGTIFVALFVGNLIASVGLLMLGAEPRSRALWSSAGSPTSSPSASS